MLHENRFRVGRMVSQVRNQLVDALDRELARFEITAAQYVVLSILADGRADSASQVCKELAYNPGAMTRMLDRLENKNIIKRLQHPTDRRAAKLVLTDQGKAIYPELLSCAQVVTDASLGGFAAEELVQLEGFLARILASSQATAPD
jgi:DNA-binding MarR family transcriptional regulator